MIIIKGGIMMFSKVSGIRRFLSLVLIGFMIFTIIPLSASATEITDVSNYWVQDAIETGINRAGTETTLTFSTDLVIRKSHKIVVPASLISIEITSPADKLIYEVGELLDIAGLEVTGTYRGGRTKVETITTSNVTGFDSSAVVESQILTVTVGRKTTSYTISVTKADGPALTGVTADDATNTVSGMMTTMEYKFDSDDWVTYVPSIFGTLDFTGDHTILIRYEETATHTAGEATTFNFTVPVVNIGKLLITFDDGWKDTITLGKPILDSAGFKGTVYVNRDMTLGEEYGWGYGNFMDYTELHTLYDDGWDISNHTTNHLDYKRTEDGLSLVDLNGDPLEWQTPEAYGPAHPEIDEDDWYEAWLETLVAIGSDPDVVETKLKAIYLENQEWLTRIGPDIGPDGNVLGKMIDGVWTLGEGLNMPRGADHVAYPSGLYSPQLIDMLIDNNVLTGRATIENQDTSNNYIFDPENKNFFELPVQYVETEYDGGRKDENLKAVKESINYAVENGSTIILMIHRVGPAGDLFVEEDSLQSIVNYAKDLKDAGQLQVMTISEWYDVMNP
jgi:hypothetical protein